MKINVVYALTANYYHKLLPSLRSLAEHHPDARVFVVAETDELPFESPLKLEVINVSGQTTFPPTGPNYHNMFTYINLLKCCYASLLPVNKVIHLDVDTIVCDSLEEMWKTNVTGKWLAAADEVHGRYKVFGPHYYNAGVMLLNLAQIRKDKIEPEMIQYLNTVKQPWAEQDAWNKFGIERDMIVPLPARFNENRMTEISADPAIVHYCSIHDWYENPRIPRAEYLAKYK